MSLSHLKVNEVLRCPELGEVALWHFNHSDFKGGEVAELSEVLSPDERLRAERFHFDKDGRQFAVARSCLRILLGRYLNEAPDKVQIELGAFGKPFLKTSSTSESGNLFFNVAHSAEHILIAFSLSTELGVDIEALRLDEERMKPLIRNICTENEKRWVQGIESTKVELALSRLWTAKEAALKAVGSGFQIPPNQLEIEKEILEGGQDCYAASSSAFEPGQGNAIVIYPMPEFENEVGCSASLSVKGGDRSVRISRKEPLFE